MRALRTARLWLRAATLDELGEIDAAAKGRARSTLSPSAGRWMQGIASTADPRLGGGWSFRHALTRKLVGVCLYFSRDGEAAEVSYIVAPRHRRRGYCGEAMTEIVRELFEEVGFARLYADVAPDNAASLQVLSRLGFGAGEAGDDIHVGLDQRAALRHHLHAPGRVRDAGAKSEPPMPA